MISAPSGATVLAVNYTLITLGVIIIGARIYLRLIIQRQKLVAADWIRILAWCSAFATASFDVVFMKEGALDAEINYTLSNWEVKPEKLERVLRYMWAVIIPYFTTFYLCKSSLLVIYLELFPQFMTKRRLVLWAVVVYCVLAYIISISLQLFLCFPIRRNWSILGPDEFCDDWALVTIFQVAWALHFIGSLSRFALPFLVLYKLNMRSRVKVSVYCIFLLGLVDIAFSLTRFLTIQLSNVDDFRSITTVELWSALDAYIGLIIACLPALRPYLRRKGSKYNDAGSGRPVTSAAAARRTAQNGFEEIDDGTPSLDGGAESGPWAVTHSPELGAGWSDKSNRSDIELVRLDVTAVKDQANV